MSFREFKNKYFEDWRIAGISTYGNERGYIKLRNKDSFIKLYFKFNGAKHWTDDCVTLDYIEGCDIAYSKQGIKEYFYEVGSYEDCN